MKKYRRSVSPVVAVIFLLGITVGAIGVALTIIIPNVQRTTDLAVIAEIDSNLQALDEFLIDLVNQPLNTSSEIRQTASRGTISFDNNSRFRILAEIPEKQVSVITIPFSRIIMETNLEGDSYPPGSHFYGKGSSEQPFFALNASTQKIAPRAILNFSRPTDEPVLYASLGYRILVETTYLHDYSVITTIKALKFTFKNKVLDSLTGNLFTAKYTNIETSHIFTQESTLNALTKLTIITEISGGGTYVETPLTIQPEYYAWTVRVIVSEIEIEI